MASIWLINSNTTLVKVKCTYATNPVNITKYSNTTLVKVKFLLGIGYLLTYMHSNTTLVKVKYRVKEGVAIAKEFKYNTC